MTLDDDELADHDIFYDALQSLASYDKDLTSSAYLPSQPPVVVQAPLDTLTTSSDNADNYDYDWEDDGDDGEYLDNESPPKPS